MVVGSVVANDTLELAGGGNRRRRGSSSSDVVPEDDGIEQSAAGATMERGPMEDSTRAEPPTRTDSGSAIALVKRAARRASSALLSLKSSSSRDLFFSRSNTGPSWLRKLSAARRSADSRESIDEQSMSSKSAKGVARDALDRADAATSFRPLPREVLDDGFKVPNFDVTRLQDIGDRPTGRGCQAYIWRCVVPEGKKAGQVCALKVMRESQARTQRDRETLVREAHFLCRMRSPYVLRSLGVSETVDKLPCLLLEWCASDLKRALQLELVGTDAAARKAVLAAWPSAERLRLMRELASALEYLHSGDAIAGGIACIHRDLKPDNIGLSASKKIKLFDFGLAVAVKREGDDDGVYELTGGTGSRRYMAPEVCLRENYGTKVDVYSWAIAAWEIWNLKGKPFTGYDIEKHLRLVVHAGERPKVPMAWNGDLNELLATAWHFDQRVRCTAGFVVGVLTRLANDTGPDPLADGKTRSLRSRISGGTKWLGLRSKSKSPKFGADRKHYYPDDDTA